MSIETSESCCFVLAYYTVLNAQSYNNELFQRVYCFRYRDVGMSGYIKLKVPKSQNLEVPTSQNPEIPKSQNPEILIRLRKQHSFRRRFARKDTFSFLFFCIQRNTANGGFGQLFDFAFSLSCSVPMR